MSLATVVAMADGAVLFPSDGTACKARPGTKVTLNGNGSLEIVCDGTCGVVDFGVRTKGCDSGLAIHAWCTRSGA